MGKWSIEDYSPPEPEVIYPGRMRDLDESCAALRRLCEEQRYEMMQMRGQLADLQDDRERLQQKILTLEKEIRRYQQKYLVSQGRVKEESIKSKGDGSG